MIDMVESIIKKDNGEVIETKSFGSINEAFKYAEKRYIHYYIETEGGPIYPIDNLDLPEAEESRRASNYKIRVLDEEFFMVLTDEEYRGIAMLAAMSHGAIEITLVE